MKFAPAELTLLSPNLSDEIYRKTSGLTIFVGYRGQDVGLMNSINKTDKASSVYWIDIKEPSEAEPFETQQVYSLLEKEVLEIIFYMEVSMEIFKGNGKIFFPSDTFWE